MTLVHFKRSEKDSASVRVEEGVYKISREIVDARDEDEEFVILRAKGIESGPVAIRIDAITFFGD